MPPRTPKKKHDDILYDAQAAERGYRDTAALRAAVKDPELPRLDIQQAALFGLRMAAELAKPEVRERFALLPDALLSPALVHRIDPASWALWYASAQRATAEAKESGARVSQRTLQRAGEVKGRMLRVAEYMLADDPDAGPEVASIRAGTGYADLAEDLTRLAKLYQDHGDTLENGGAHYRAGDVRLAKEVAAAILGELGSAETPQAKNAREEAARAFRVLEQAYEPVRRYALAMFPDGEQRFPTIFSVRPYRATPPGGGGGSGGGGGGGGGGGEGS